MNILKNGTWPGRKSAEELLAAAVTDEAFLDELAAAARRRSAGIFGKRVFLRGLVEIGNVCRNDCYYCGIRASNTKVRRYMLSPEEILDTCRSGYEAGLRTFVLQGGETPRFDDGTLCSLVRDIKEEMPDCAVTLSLGERGAESFARLRQAGADRYLLRHEAAREDLFYRMHPRPRSEDPEDVGATTGHAKRMAMLGHLMRLGYQTGTGFMVGVPGQTFGDLAADLDFIAGFRPHMVGIGPYMRHPDTPFGAIADAFWTDSFKLRATLACVAVTRLALPYALIPSTTALGTISPHGRLRGVLSGANVIMPNISPPEARLAYELYSGKVTDGGESRAALESLAGQLAGIGYEADPGRGDWTGC